MPTLQIKATILAIKAIVICLIVVVVYIFFMLTTDSLHSKYISNHVFTEPIGMQALTNIYVSQRTYNMNDEEYFELLEKGE